MTKLISWNVNGLRACVGKNFLDFFHEADADVFCLQETKLQAGQIDLDLPGYHQYWNYAEKKGYSGTALFTKEEPLSVAYGIGVEEHDHEGRVITAEFPEYYVITCYTPNSQNELARLDYRMEWEDAWRAYLKGLAMTMEPIFQVGKSSVTPEFTKAVDEALTARELIKLSVLQNCADDPRAIAEVIADRTRSQVVQVIGKKIVLYRENTDEKYKKKKIVLPL